MSVPSRAERPVDWIASLERYMHGLEAFDKAVTLHRICDVDQKSAGARPRRRRNRESGLSFARAMAPCFQLVEGRHKPGDAHFGSVAFWAKWWRTDERRRRADGVRLANDSADSRNAPSPIVPASEPNS